MTAVVLQVHHLDASGFDGDCATWKAFLSLAISELLYIHYNTYKRSRYKRRHLPGGAFWIVFVTCSPFYVDSALTPPWRLLGKYIYSILCVVYIVLPFVPIIHPPRWLPDRSWHPFATAYCHCSLQSSKPIIDAILLLAIINNVTRDRSVLPWCLSTPPAFALSTMIPGKLGLSRTSGLFSCSKSSRSHPRSASSMVPPFPPSRSCWSLRCRLLRAICPCRSRGPPVLRTEGKQEMA